MWSITMLIYIIAAIETVPLLTTAVSMILAVTVEMAEGSFTADVPDIWDLYPSA